MTARAGATTAPARVQLEASRRGKLLLEDLVLAACNEALRKSREMVQAEMGKLTAGLKIPGLGM